MTESKESRVGDGPDKNGSSYEERFGIWKNGGGDEESFLARIHNSSEKNISKLISDSINQEVKEQWKLDTLLPEAREQIWNRLNPSDLKSVRGTCRKFRSEIDNDVGIQLYFCDVDDESLRLALTTTVQRLVIAHLEMTTLGNLIPVKPNRLKELKLQGCVSVDAIHEILLRCPNIQKLEIDHCFEGMMSGLCDNEDESISMQYKQEKFKDWVDGNLFRPQEEIRYLYGCFSKLQEIHFRSGENQSQHKPGLLPHGLLPILNCINSPLLSKIDICIFVTAHESKILTEALFNLFIRTRALSFLNLSHFHTDAFPFDPSHQPVVYVDKNNGSSPFSMKFSDARPTSQFKVLKLETPEFPSSYYDWLFLLQQQRRLVKLVWDIGSNYYGLAIEAIKKSAKTLESVTLKTIRCYPMSMDAGTTGPASAVSLTNFREFIKLKHLHLTGVEETFETNLLCAVDSLPVTLQNVQIECFQMDAEQLLQLHRCLPVLKFLSINHWNMRTHRANFIESLKVISEIVGTPGKYKALTFLEKTMYSNAEELTEINDLLNGIKEAATSSDLQVDDVSSDNGIGFILVIGNQKQSTGF